MGSPGFPGRRPTRTSGQKGLANFGRGLFLIGTALAAPVHAKETFEPDNCFQLLGRPHIWNLCDFYRDRRIRRAVEKELPRALEKLDFERYEIPDSDISPDSDLDSDPFSDDLDTGPEY